jgi:imidazolonepropionase-like amidohydrolase
MITTEPARALQCGSQLGCLGQGAWADWVAWRIPLDQNPLESILKSRQIPEWTCVGGVVAQHETI